MKRIRNILEQRLDSEHQPTLIRLLVTGLVFFYALLGYANEWLGTAAAEVLVIYGIYLLLAACLLVWLLLRPQVSPGRRMAGISLDMTGLGVSLYFLGAAGAVLFPVYIWIIAGSGFRFGQRYLYSAMSLAVAVLKELIDRLTR